jgi:hypothetical protein
MGAGQILNQWVVYKIKRIVPCSSASAYPRKNSEKNK